MCYTPLMFEIILTILTTATTPAPYAPQVCLATEFANIDKTTGKVEAMAGEKFFCLNRAVDDKTPGIAHRTLPCGTRVLLVNIRNGRTTKAKVIDRGPFWNTPKACSRSVHGRFAGHACWRKGHGAVKLRAGYVRANCVDVTPPVARKLRLRGKEPVLIYALPRGRYLW